MEYLVLLGIVVFLVIIIFGVGVYQEKGDLKRYMQILANKYGKEREYTYPSGRFEKIPMFYKHNMPKHFVDDITWNDLNMDEIFKKMNFTESTVGEEYLYYMLRNMDCDTSKMEKQEEMIAYFMENEEARIYMQMLYHSVGKGEKYSIFDYLDYMEQINVKSNLKQTIINVLLILSIGLCFFESGIGVILVVSLLILNILTYFKEKKKLEPYLCSLAYVQRLLDVAKKLCGIKIEILQGSQTEIKKVLNKFKDFSANSMWIQMGSGQTGSSNPLDIILDYLRMVTHVDLMIFSKLFKKLQGRKAEVCKMVEILGEIEACIAIGWYRNTLPYYTLPEFDEKNLNMQEGYHPLIENAVPNSIMAEGGVLITGSNASGKSTFLKMVAINVILAQGIHTVCAREYKSQIFEVFSSMALRDSVVEGDSYFMVEIKSIKRILEKVKESKRKMICFVDEVLRGTNTVERIAASTHILMCLQKAETICFAATHDIELARLLKDTFANYHFEENIEGNDVKFNYLLCEGKATSRNAIKLLKVLGYDDTLVKDAENMATNFLKTGKWVVYGKEVLHES